jgi:CBS domain-containing protein
LQGNPPFFLHLARDLLQKKLPSHLAGGILRDVLRTGLPTLDVKEAVAPLVAFARLFALRHGVTATNTFERLAQLREMSALKPSTADDVMDAYGFLMSLRLSRGDSVDPRALTNAEVVALRHALAQLALVHRTIGFEFPGTAF